MCKSVWEVTVTGILTSNGKWKTQVSLAFQLWPSVSVFPSNRSGVAFAGHVPLLWWLTWVVVYRALEPQTPCVLQIFSHSLLLQETPIMSSNAGSHFQGSFLLHCWLSHHYILMPFWSPCALAPMFNLQIIVILIAGRKQVWSLVMVSFFCEIWLLHLMLI